MTEPNEKCKECNGLHYFPVMMPRKEPCEIVPCENCFPEFFKRIRAEKEAAVFAERDRSAKIAEDVGLMYPTMSKRFLICHEVAACIRENKSVATLISEIEIQKATNKAKGETNG